ncbi:Tex family protein [Marinobacterium jannaschii]|uniref:Tex family protein n=1 Tax=Marinobacterium jannaschii TaxID=64970 RepID=UPI000486E4EB|nr:Tex family protein [Marinobacterium jannaschii]
MQLEQQIANELQVRPQQVSATIQLLDEGATVPFIARYRKEVTGALDDTQLRQLEQRLSYLRELNDRRKTVLDSIRQQGRLSPELELQIQQADSKGRLEDLYLPYRPKRRTKAQQAREAGLEPLADQLLQSPQLDPAPTARQYLNPEAAIDSAEKALDGARQILLERFSEQAELLTQLREWLWRNGQLSVRVVRGKSEEGSKFRDYFDYNEQIQKMPSHRALAVLRGQREGILKFSLLPPEEHNLYPVEQIRRSFGLRDNGRPADAWLAESAAQCWKQKLHGSLENDLIKRLREQAETEAIRVFGRNLKDLMLAAPAGNRATMGLDPGLRTGVKVAVVDATGKMLEHATIYPHAPKKQWDQSLATLGKLARKHNVELLSIGNGTASRETEQLAQELTRQLPELAMTAVMVSESGASVYSASELAAKEFPELDVSIRGAVSIARRLQDPLAELVKIEARAIGVGQYQHDVDQSALSDSLDNVVEDCVNHVGVDVNMASVELLTQVAGLNRTTAQNIVAYRDDNGRFEQRKQLLKVPRLGPKAFEQCAGFLRIRGGNNSLDNSAVHPEAYPLVEQMAAYCQCPVEQLVGNSQQLEKLRSGRFSSDQFGSYTIADTLSELDKPGRDPRGEFKTARFSDGIEKPEDLEVNMQLEGVVTNVTNFGAFVDIGVHQDGLVHISHLANRFIKDPHEVVKAGDIVQVRVLEVDLKRRRIALSMKAAHGATEAPPPAAKPRGQQPEKRRAKPAPATKTGTLGDILAAAGLKR